MSETVCVQWTDKVKQFLTNKQQACILNTYYSINKGDSNIVKKFWIYYVIC